MKAKWVANNSRVAVDDMGKHFVQIAEENGFTPDTCGYLTEDDECTPASGYSAPEEAIENRILDAFYSGRNNSVYSKRLLDSCK